MPVTCLATPSADHGDRAFAVGAADQMHSVVRAVGRRVARIGDAAQSQVQPVAHLLGDGDDLGLLGRQLERRCLADDRVGALAAVLLADLLDGLVDGEHADVVEDRLGGELGTAGAGVGGLSTRRVMMTSTWSLGRMKPPALVSAAILMATARLPSGRMADMKPRSEWMSLASLIGSPA